MVELIVNLLLLGLVIFLLLLLSEMGKDIKRIADAIEKSNEKDAGKRK